MKADSRAISGGDRIDGRRSFPSRSQSAVLQVDALRQPSATGWSDATCEAQAIGMDVGGDSSRGRPVKRLVGYRSPRAHGVTWKHLALGGRNARQKAERRRQETSKIPRNFCLLPSAFSRTPLAPIRRKRYIPQPCVRQRLVEADAVATIVACFAGLGSRKPEFVAALCARRALEWAFADRGDWAGGSFPCFRGDRFHATCTS